MLAGRLDFLDHIRRNGLFADLLAVVAVEIHRFFADQVNHAFEVLFQTNRKLRQHGIAAEFGTELLNHLLGVSTGTVHLVDERQTGHAIAAHLPIDGQRLSLHPSNGAKDENGPIQDAEAALNFDGEVDVAGSVDQVDVVAVPCHRGRRTGNRDSAFPLQIHVIHGGTGPAALHFLHAVNTARVVQHSLAESGLPGIDVGRNPDVT